MEHIEKHMRRASTRHNERQKRNCIPTVSRVLDDGTLIELVYDATEKNTALIIFKNKTWKRVARYSSKGEGQLIPYAATNNLIAHGVVLLPSKPEEYSSERDLFDDVRTFIHRYVDVSEAFERIAAAYVLLSWVYDCFNELPYLRLRGDYGSGKTRFLLTVGSLCYKPIFASGASTVSPLFHILNTFGGTLIVDEADFRFSDEKSDIIKILNNGNVRGIPVLRTHVSKSGEYNPQAFQVFGPKLAATRGSYQDRALESRFITENMGHQKLRDDIPINLPDSYAGEAQTLRNKLLLYRFRSFGAKTPQPELMERMLEPRFKQIVTPLMSIIDDKKLQNELRTIASLQQADLAAMRVMDVEGDVLLAIHKLRALNKPLTIKAITNFYREISGSELTSITPKWIGSVIRNKLHLKTHKSNGVFVIPISESKKLDYLFEKYGVITTTD